MDAVIQHLLEILIGTSTWHKYTKVEIIPINITYP